MPLVTSESLLRQCVRGEGVPTNDLEIQCKKTIYFRRVSKQRLEKSQQYIFYTAHLFNLKFNFHPSQDGNSISQILSILLYTY